MSMSFLPSRRNVLFFPIHTYFARLHKLEPGMFGHIVEHLLRYDHVCIVCGVKELDNFNWSQIARVSAKVEQDGIFCPAEYQVFSRPDNAAQIKG